MKKIILLLLAFIVINNKAISKTDQVAEEKKDIKAKNEAIINKNIDSISKLSAQKEQLIQLPKKDSTVLAKIAFLDSSILNLKRTNELLATKQCCDDDTQSNTLSIAILVFGLIIMLAILVFQKKKAPETNYHPFKLIGLMFIGTVSVFLIPAGFSNNQITPIIGLLGTLAGYLVGSSNNAALNPPKPADPAHADNKAN